MRLTFVQLVKLLKPYLGRFLLAIACTLGGVALSMILPLLIQSIVDSVLQSRDLAALNWFSALLLALFLFEFLTSFGRDYLLPTVGNLITADLRVRMYEHLQKLALSFYERTHVGELMSRMTNDINAVQNAVTRDLVNVLRQILTLIVGISLIVYIEWKLALLSISPLLAIPPLMKRIGGSMREKHPRFISGLQMSVHFLRKLFLVYGSLRRLS
ncbi:ABC transporter ATP-binding protein [Candidatus Bathyarchaeota archaeon]|nr:MAG: ABC transporter ATP-binding protein [Candidatus Bathyarchaeota archaeon]